MRGLHKALGIVGLTAAIFAFSGPAHAIVCNTEVSTINGWTTCDIGDKTFTKNSSNIPGTTGLAIEQIGSLYILAQTFDTGGTVDVGAGITGPVGPFVLDYSITVTDPDFFITLVHIDSTVAQQPGSGTTTITKQIFDINNVLLDTIVSTDGSSDDSIALHHQFIRIVETIIIGTDATLLSAVNDITQTFQPPTQTPEPATLGILGLGLAGLGLLRRRRAA